MKSYKVLFSFIGILITIGVLSSLTTSANTIPVAPDKFVGGVEFSFTTATQATSTVTPNSWTAIGSATNGSQGFESICDNADTGVDVNKPIYLGFGATSTKPFGFKLASGSCYTMSLSQDNMFYGTIYATASTATSTILQVYK